MMDEHPDDEVEMIAEVFAGNDQAELLPLLKRFDADYIRCDVGRGWYPLLLALHEDLIVTDPDYRVVQVKKKFGLRFYTATPLSAAGRVRVQQAEEESARICESCGAPGTPHGDFTKVTLCEDCATRSH